MGRSFYRVRECPNRCEHCALQDEHIGRSSVGWSFIFSGATGKRSWKEWRTALEGEKIITEHGEPVSFDAFCDLVEAKKNLASDHEESVKRGRTGTWMDEEGHSFCGHEFS